MQTINTKIVSVTPAMAAEFLKSNLTNRAVRIAQVNRLKNEILAERWMVTHQGIAFADDGSLIDGQHRLMAIQASGKTVQLMVTRGVLKKTGRNGDSLFAMDVIDCGKNRTAADQLNLMHGVKNANLTAATCRVIVETCLNGHGGASIKGLTVGQCMGILHIYGDAIGELIRVADSKVAKKAAVIAVLTLGYHCDPQIAIEFMAALSTGEDVRRGDPVYHLRERIINAGVGAGHVQRTVFLQCAANAFYNTLKGNEVRVLKSGTMGIDYLLGKQRQNIAKLKDIIFPQ